MLKHFKHKLTDIRSVKKCLYCIEMPKRLKLSELQWVIYLRCLLAAVTI